MITLGGYNYAKAFVVLGVLCLVSADAHAFAGGTGAPDDPFQVASPQHLLLIGSDTRLLDKCYRLVADIDLAPNQPDGRVFRQAVIAPDTDSAMGFQGVPFVGRFDGEGHAIRHLTMEGGSNSHVALFGALGDGGEVIDLNIVDANIAGDKDGAYVSGLVGTNEGYITGCHVSGNVGGDYGVGAIAGRNASRGTIVRCRATGTFKGEGRMQVVGGIVGLNDGRIAKSWVRASRLRSKDSMDFLGGLVGQNFGTISACYAEGELEGGMCLGGLVAENAGFIASCHARADVHSRELSRWLGGLVGGNSGRVVNSYANGTILNAYPETSAFGGLIGLATESARTVNCFWNLEVGAMCVSDGGMGLTTSQMQNPDVYSLNGWGGDPNWVLDPLMDYPRLAWEVTAGQPIPLPVLDWFEGSGTQEDPYVISTAEQLARIGTASVLWDKVFILASDVNMAGTEWIRIGICPGTDFVGRFDGDGHAIINLAIDTGKASVVSAIGMFGHIGTGGQVRNLTLKDAVIKCGGSAQRVGILAGVNEGTVAACVTSGSVSGGDYSNCLGQLAGYNGGNIVDCSSTAIISAGRASSRVAGLTGYNRGSITP